MALFQNITLHPIPIVLNGIRKTIRPGEQFHGPDNMCSIPGISLLNANTKTIIVKSDNPGFIPLKLNNTNNQAVSVDTSQPTTITNYLKVDEEIKYLEHMKSLNSKPSITLAILTKNRLKLITDCCESIFNKVQYSNTTIMIIDTGTTENAVKDYYSTLSKKCLDKGWVYKYVQLNEFHYSKNYNVAIINNVDTEYVLIQNNDTVAINDYVTEMMGTAIIRKVGSVGCRMLYPDNTSIQHDGQTIFNAQNEMFGSASHINLRVNKSSVPKTQSFTHFVDGNTAAGCLVRTSDFKSVGGFDEKFGDIFQDVHFMIKLPQLTGRYNYCNRQAVINHIDNASRLESGVDQKKHAQMWEDTHYLRKTLIENRWGKLKKPITYDFSIITCVYDLDSYRDFLHSIKRQIGSHTVEIIAIPNFYNHFDSAYKALNMGADVASGNVLIYCHDDVVVTPDWLSRIKTDINTLKSKNVPIGVLGPAGIASDSNEAGIYFLLDENNTQIKVKNVPAVNPSNPIVDVQILDELCLITLKSSGLRFDDELLSGWHFYGSNLCLKAKISGLRNFAIDAWCHHKSDGHKNLNTLKKFNDYEKCAKELDSWAKTMGINSWRSTTAKSHSNILHLFPVKPKE